MGQNNTLNGAVIGAGFMGKTHLEGYMKLDTVKIQAVIDPNGERAKLLAEPRGLSWYESIDEAARHHSLDFIDICVPTPYHVESVEKAFQQGCHVLVEKPVTANIDDLRRIHELVRSTDRRFMVAHVCRFMPAYIFAKDVIDSGRLGRPLALSARRYFDQPVWSLNDWINDRKKSGGTIVDLSIHDIDIANWFLGRPKHVYGSEITKVPKGPSHVLETIEYETESIAHVEASHLLPKGYQLTSEYQLVFENGFLSSTTSETGTVLWEFSGGQWKQADFSQYVTWEDPYTEEVSHFVSCVVSGDDFRISLEDATNAVLAAVSLEKSVEEKTGISLITL